MKAMNILIRKLTKLSKILKHKGPTNLWSREWSTFLRLRPARMSADLAGGAVCMGVLICHTFLRGISNKTAAFESSIPL